MVYYRYHIMIRQNVSVLLRVKRLFQQYLVDAYCKIETERLQFLRCEQTALRADCYQDLRDAILDRDGDPNNVGHRIILPSTFTGGPRYMHERQQDAMSTLGNMGTLICLLSQQQIQAGQRLRIICFLVRILRTDQT